MLLIEIDHYGERLVGCMECNRCFRLLTWAPPHRSECPPHSRRIL